MARVFVTGSADGLGKMAAELLIEKGHKVVLHARNAARAEETREKIAAAPAKQFCFARSSTEPCAVASGA